MKINKWLSHLCELNKDKNDETINEIRTYLFEVRNRTKKDYELIK